MDKWLSLTFAIKTMSNRYVTTLISSNLKYVCAHLMYQSVFVQLYTNVKRIHRVIYLSHFTFLPNTLKWFVVCTLWFCLFANFQSMTCANITHHQWNYMAIRLLIYIFVFSTTRVTNPRHNKFLDVIEKVICLVS